MPLNAKHKAYIESTISCRFDDLPDSVDPLRMEISTITHAFHNHNESDRFSRIFQNPRLISRIQDSGPLNLGEVREYIIEYTDKIIVNAANRIGKTSQDLGWDQHKILALTQQRSDHNEPLISEYVPVLPLYLAELKAIQKGDTPFPIAQEPSSKVTLCTSISPMLPVGSMRQDELRQTLERAKKARDTLLKSLQSTARIGHFTAPSPGANYSGNPGRSM